MLIQLCRLEYGASFNQLELFSYEMEIIPNLCEKLYVTRQGNLASGVREQDCTSAAEIRMTGLDGYAPLK